MRKETTETEELHILRRIVDVLHPAEDKGNHWECRVCGCVTPKDDIDTHTETCDWYVWTFKMRTSRDRVLADGTSYRECSEVVGDES